MTQMWSLDNLLIILDTNDVDRAWLRSIGCVTNGERYHTCYGLPCIPIFPSEKQLTLIVLKYGDRLKNIPVTAREITEIYNPYGYTPGPSFSK